MSRASATVRLWELGSALPLDKIRHFVEETFSPGLACAKPGRLAQPGKAAPLARRCMDLRIADPGRLGTPGNRHSAGELARMCRILEGEASPDDRHCVLFSGLGLQALLASVMGPKVFRNGDIHIVFTAALPCTWEPQDCRYHARTVLCGFPSVVSVSGAVEGPTKPRGYYVAKMMGLTEDEARRKYIGRFLEHDDPRMPEVAKGLAAQAIFYHLTGEPFCEHEDCRLFNAHWQAQLVRSQVDSRRFCNSHARFLKDLKRPKGKK